MTEKIFIYPHHSLPSIGGSKTLVGGCFDLLHYGHLCFFKAAKQLASTLIVCVEPDQTIERVKGAPPIHTQSQRAEILAELICINAVLLLPSLQNYDDYLTLVKTVRPDFLAVTQGDPQLANKQLQAKAVGASVVEVNPLIEGLSSSLIRQHHL